MTAFRGANPLPGESRLGTGHDDPGSQVRKQAALYRELQGVYERLCVFAAEGQPHRLSEEVDRTEALVADLQRLASETEPALSMMARGSAVGRRPSVTWPDMEQVLGDLVQARQRVLQVLGDAVVGNQSTLARLGHGRRALGRYRIPRSSAPRFRSSRV